MKFVMAGGTMQEVTAYNVLANPIKDSISDWFLHHVEIPIANAIDKTIESYYQFISWSFSNLTKLITTFPIDILTQPQLHRMQGVFMGYSVLMVTILTMVEGMKAVFGMSYTKMTSLIGRTVFGFVAAGLTVPALIFIIKCANMLVAAIMKMGSVDGEQFGLSLMNTAANGGLNFIASLTFMIAFFYFIITALFKVGRRWFDLLMNMVASPFAWAAYATEGTTKYLNSWLHSTGQLILTNVVYAFYVLVISAIVMLPAGAETAAGYFARLLLIVGGLYRLAHPPGWLAGMGGGASIKPVMKDIADLVTLKKFKGLRKKGK